MSIIIKGMDMPVGCDTCRLSNGIICYAMDNENDYTTDKIGFRKWNCPLIEIPTPHGRLIDASELDKCWEEKEDISEDVDFKILYKCVLAISKYAPTILEAEGE